jgi:hypothetical protein
MDRNRIYEMGSSLGLKIDSLHPIMEQLFDPSFRERHHGMLAEHQVCCLPHLALEMFKLSLL